MEPTKCPPKPNNIVTYGVIPIVLIITFIILVHPKTSSILGKYLPPMTSMKGYLIRGVILAVVYVVLRLVTQNSIKK